MNYQATEPAMLVGNYRRGNRGGMDEKRWILFSKITPLCLITSIIIRIMRRNLGMNSVAFSPESNSYDKIRKFGNYMGN